MLKSFILFVLFLALLFISCKKEAATTPIPPSPNQVNAAPYAFADADIYVVFPDNSCTLKGSGVYGQIIKTISWSKIAGPGSFVIETPGSFQTKVHNLEKGIYLFELTVTDKAGLTGKDTVSVIVLGKNEVVFKDLQWSCPWGCSFQIENFYSFIPSGSAFKVFLKKDNSIHWVEVINGVWSRYMWSINNNTLHVWDDGTIDEVDTPDIKIAF